MPRSSFQSTPQEPQMCSPARPDPAGPLPSSEPVRVIAIGDRPVLPVSPLVEPALTLRPAKLRP
jgi:hypothetical protein